MSEAARDDGKCFVCGRDNPSGLHLSFTDEGDRYVTEFVAGDAYQGYPGIVHGGIISTVLDEVMARFARVRGHVAYTAEMTVRFRKPVPCGMRVRFEGEIEEIRGRRVRARARAIAPDGSLMADATACLISKGSRGG